MRTFAGVAGRPIATRPAIITPPPVTPARPRAAKVTTLLRDPTRHLRHALTARFELVQVWRESFGRQGARASSVRTRSFEEWCSGWPPGREAMLAGCAQPSASCRPPAHDCDIPTEPEPPTGCRTGVVPALTGKSGDGVLRALVFGVVSSSALVIGGAIGAYWLAPERFLGVLLASGLMISALSFDLFAEAFDLGGAGRASRRSRDSQAGHFWLLGNAPSPPSCAVAAWAPAAGWGRRCAREPDRQALLRSGPRCRARGCPTWPVRG
jgi:hypothetical protein